MTHILTDYQKKILNYLVRGYILQTNEGQNFKAWIVNTKGNKLYIRRDTANILFKAGFIRPIERNSPFFEYEYTGKVFKS